MKNKFIQFSSSLVFIFLFASCQNREVSSTDTVLSVAVSENESDRELTESDTSAKKFEWQFGLCENTGFYETGKFSEKQLRDTYFLLFEYNSVTALNTDATLDEPEYYNANYIGNSLKKLEQEYLVAVQKLKKLDLVPTQFWLKHKELSLLQLEELYKLKKLALEAHLNPTLLEGTPNSDKCRRYISALISEDTTELLNAWKKHVELKKSNNGAPEKLEQEYQRQLETTDRLLFARIDLMNYGWWNCANNQRKYVDGFNQEGQMTKEFDRLFIKVESECDE
ncbi:hypothetical protein [Pontibacter akesuensis]|uniref:Uncharacterized protein n=1 Tax=Pontibacter akesuensis TaxID=388950 RepID=A0A1I7HUX6_9BACT|nr:hypothetical protein [Pontibacter akesuensis]GHA63681.1 hypothetical protein GCM10007389_15360 [Pontibacter akesuensis]SFU64535.1 hypothetical protein SAMN04487941_1695 [Pontibacter akesuensis]